MKGYVQVYTGNGKGKTTAALGLALRAAGAGLKVYIGQFLKQGDYGEIKALERFSESVRVEQFGAGKFVMRKPSPEELTASRIGYEKIKVIVASGEYDVVIIEEGNVAVTCGLFSIDELLEIVAIRPDGVELVITGRGADPRLVEKADLVTEMTEIKHYFQNGVTARIGIEK